MIRTQEHSVNAPIVLQAQFIDNYFKGREIIQMSETRRRNFRLELSDEDIRSFTDKCRNDGTTPEEVLEGFINDLIGGSQTRGSDGYSCQFGTSIL